MLYSNAHSKIQSQSEILDGLELFCEPGEVYELRCPKTAHDGTVSGYFDDLNKLAYYADYWSGISPSVYITLNPVQRDLLARAANRIHAEPGKQLRITRLPDAAACFLTSIPCDRLASAAPMKNTPPPSFVPRSARTGLPHRDSPSHSWQTAATAGIWCTASTCPTIILPVCWSRTSSRLLPVGFQTSRSRWTCRCSTPPVSARFTAPWPVRATTCPNVLTACPESLKLPAAFPRSPRNSSQRSATPGKELPWNRTVWTGLRFGRRSGDLKAKAANQSRQPG